MGAKFAGILASALLAIAAQDAWADVLVRPMMLETVTREGVAEKIQATLMKPDGDGEAWDDSIKRVTAFFACMLKGEVQ